MTKIVLTSVSIASCAIVLGISIALAVDPSIQSYIVVWTAPQAAVALFWSAATELATTCAWRSKSTQRGIHPGAHVAIQLLLWLGFAAGLGLTAYVLADALVFLSFDGWEMYPEYHNYYYEDDGDGYEYYSKFYMRSMKALVAFLALLT